MKKTLFAMLLLITIALSATIVACSSEVKKVAVTGVSLDETASVVVGTTKQLSAKVLPDNATNKKVTWLSSNTDIASIDANGLVTAITSGTSIITVTTEDGGFTATCTVTVTPAPVPVEGVKLNKTATDLTVGGTETLTATVEPTSATDKSVTWSSSNTTVATVSNEGVVTGIAAGTATITVKSNYDESKTATCNVTINTSKAPSGNFITISSENPFTVTIPFIFDGTLQYYSTANSTWTDLEATTKTNWASPTQPVYLSCTDLTSENGKLYLRGKNNTTISKHDGFDYGCAWKISATSGVSLSGNIMSLLDCDNPPTEMDSSNNSCFKGLFSNWKCLTYTNNLTLKATTLAEFCYKNMFSGCSSLETAPKLPATTLANSCYMSMFANCSSLEEAPVPAATTLANSCYMSMFANCKSLTKSPELPVTSLTDYCYNGMFDACTNLTDAPALPATSLTSSCYYGMFKGCTSLTSAPVLSATDLGSDCYKEMFKGCTSLESAPKLPATDLAPNCYSRMFQSCTDLKNAPALPATTLTNSCYENMFDGCTSLESAPVLSAIDLAPGCYQQMFRGCTNLKNAPALPATTLCSGCYYNMFQGCSSLYVSDSQVSGTAEIAWTIPESGTFTNTCEQPNMFTDCLGTRSSNNMAGAAGSSYTYYTQKAPVK